MPAGLTRRLHLPHPFALLVIGILIAAGATWVLPAGEFQRRHDPGTGRDVVVTGTWHPVPPQPVGPGGAMVAIPRGLEAAADVIALVFLVGGAFAVVEQTGVLGRAVRRLARGVARREVLVIPVCCLAFAAGGALENMQEEIIAFVPVLLMLTRGLGFDALTAAAMSVGAAAVGSSFSPVNPFQVGIAQKLAQVPLLSGWAFRSGFLALALGIWIWGTTRHALRTRTEPERASDSDAGFDDRLGPRDLAILGLVVASFGLLVAGLLGLGWGFDELSALFFVMGAAAGLIAGLGLSGTARAFAEGFRSMAAAALLIGFARAISVVLQDGKVLDTIVQGLFQPIARLPTGLAGIAMVGVHTAVHVPVPSVSGQAVLTMPILVPLADLLGMPRQVVVLAYQYGAGLCELITPTNGALLAIIAAAGVSYERWIRFTFPLYLALVALGLVAVVTFH